MKEKKKRIHKSSQSCPFHFGFLISSQSPRELKQNTPGKPRVPGWPGLGVVRTPAQLQWGSCRPPPPPRGQEPLGLGDVVQCVAQFAELERQPHSSRTLPVCRVEGRLPGLCNSEPPTPQGGAGLPAGGQVLWEEWTGNHRLVPVWFRFTFADSQEVLCGQVTIVLSLMNPSKAGPDPLNPLAWGLPPRSHSLAAISLGFDQRAEAGLGSWKWT